MDAWILKLIETWGPWGVVVVVLILALRYVVALGKKLDESNEARVADLKGVVVKCTETQSELAVCLRQLHDRREKEIEVQEGQSRSTRLLADQVERMGNKMQCANFTPAHGVPRVGRNGD